MTEDGKPDEEDYALMILKNRLAKGEITIEEFEKLREKLASSNISKSTREEIADIKERVEELGEKQLETQKKSKNVALLLSVLCGLVGVLGIGHFYVKSKGRGAALLIGGLFLDLIIILLLYSPSILPQELVFADMEQHTAGDFVILYGLIYGGLYFVQIFDSVRMCKRYNLALEGSDSLTKTQMASGRSKIALAIVMVILVIAGMAITADLSANVSKMNSIKQQMQQADSAAQYAQTSKGYDEAYQKWRDCAQNAGNSYLSVCGNPPQSPYSNQPVDCSLASNHWLCNPYYTENNQGKSTTINASSQTLQVKPISSSVSSLKGDTAVITTKYGNMTINLLNDVAPKTVANFEKLASSGFYNGLLFHRIIPGFVIQTGDPNTRSEARNTWGTGDAGYTIPPEFNNLTFAKYTVGMARGQDVNSGSSQFFIVLGDASFLDGKYTLFGNVTLGQDIVDKISALQTNSNSQPVNPDDARIIEITIQK